MDIKPDHLNGFKVDYIGLDMDWFYIFGFFLLNPTWWDPRPSVGEVGGGWTFLGMDERLRILG